MEKKFLDFTTGIISSTIAVDDTSWTFLDDSSSPTGTILKIQQGSGESERIGRRIILTDILWNLTLEMPALAISTTPLTSEATEIFRLVIYLDKQCNGAIANTTTIFEDTDIHSYRNIENASRYTILWDKTVTLTGRVVTAWDGTNDTWTVPEVFKRVKYHWKGRIPIEYNQTFTDGRIATIRSNNIGIIALTENSSAARTAALYGQMRIRFYG